jgi:hypothetical protein
LFLLGWLQSQKHTSSVGKAVEKWEPSHNADRNVKWHNQENRYSLPVHQKFKHRALRGGICFKTQLKRENPLNTVVRLGKTMRPPPEFILQHHRKKRLNIITV